MSLNISWFPIPCLHGLILGIFHLFQSSDGLCLPEDRQKRRSDETLQHGHQIKVSRVMVT